MNPIISVIVPCYNQAIYLPEALQSVLDQDYPHWECIIVNDGSPDNTEEVAKQWTEKDSRFRYFSKANSGVCDTRNFGVKQAIGEYIIPLDGDDKIGTRYFSEAIAAFTSDPTIRLIFSDTILFGIVNDKKINPEFVFESMLTENQIFNSAIFRRADFLEVGGYNPNMVDGIEDWDFYLSLIRPDDKVVKLHDYHYYYRIKEVSRSADIARHTEKNDAMLLQMFRNHVPLFLEYFNPVRDRIEAETYKRELRWHYHTKEYRLGRILFAPYNGLKKLYHSMFSKTD
ncbi:glycosyltransferase involved in cell wall biosynthesis [Dysgonomonas sp. PFB1-18]|uniref:glycosyltransferase family 2 protein n=1 Tax=unclassified Dysgonomonas TaxID=2630389 RepID=UPI002472F215|nr:MULTISPECIES: glycosyltransferase family A protein [unclassified Dysgonomonas]MDH6309751.1 glycosyltransferase involved in cell wall biosynthesis [Dysgonomonas sp. PF1-14]MDH6339241.1 glycosyltransferase involved in cell wall biosynthesis [Dysgonomonas sp. PF1-16]MDH6380740.1 glycosyltransferase involved in cell wall biosynthesis [Dysgonomonas sp. PFB1-18]MDH6398236.1 glycosyltransferase involved in cell wall biosynthesis [Dysgonomonas sp. PF1-23]